MTRAVDDHLGAVELRIGEDLLDPFPVLQAQKQAARLAEDMAEALTAEADRRRIDHRHHLFDVPGQQRVKQCFVGILQASQKRISVDVAPLRTESFEPAHDLIVELGNMRGKEPVQIEFIPLLFGKGSPLVKKRVV